jgi:carbohydrate diacid regulator
MLAPAMEFDKLTTVGSHISFDQLAKDLIHKFSRLFEANVLILDENGTIITERRDGRAHSPDVGSGGPLEQALRVPFSLNGQCAEVVISQSPGDALSLSRLVQTIVQLVINELTFNVPVPTLPDWNESKNIFIRDLVQGAIDDERAICEQADALGLDLKTPRAVLLIDASDYIKPVNTASGFHFDVPAHHRSQFIIRTIVEYFQRTSDLICAPLGNGEIVVLKAADSRSLAPWGDSAKKQHRSSWANLAALKRAAHGLLKRLPDGPDRAFSIGIGRYHPGLKGLANSYQDARTALSLGQRLGQGSQVYCLDELGVHAFVGVADEQTKIDLALHLLSPLDNEPELVETLRVFFAVNSFPSEAANRLSVHRNTIAYRLDKIAFLTGLDPRRFDDAVQMRLALVLRAMTQNSSDLR